MHNPLTLTDRALVAYLTARAISVPIHPSKKSQEKTNPCVIVHSYRANPTLPFRGVYEVDVNVMVRTNSPVDEGEDADAATAANDSLVSSVMEALHRFGDGSQGGGDLADDITAAARAANLTDFTCQNFEIESLENSIEYTKQLDGWTDTIALKLVVCPSNVS